LNEISCSDNSHCWAAGNGGTIIATSDGGTSWTAQASNTGANLNGIAIASSAGIAAGASGPITADSTTATAYFNGAPTTAAITPTTDTAQRCITATARDSSGNALSGGYISATLTSGGNTSSSYGLASNGTFTICISGNGSLPASATVSGYVDTNGNQVQDTGEPTFSGTA
jgi:hypothetical protein